MQVVQEEQPIHEIDDVAGIGRLSRVPLREVWPHEASDFTTWLEENLDVLNEHLDLALVSAEREQSAGRFNVDLLAENEAGETVVVENQLEKTDHDHLGKLLTYLAAFDAHSAIWIASEPRPEHVKAIAWLNDSTPASFHLFRVEAVRIADSPPAPLLTPIVGPSAEGKRVAAKKKEQGARHDARFEYWTNVLEVARNRTSLHSAVSPTRHPYVSTGAGVSGMSYQYWVTKDGARVLLWIDRGKDQGALNLSIFHQLASKKTEVESRFGGELTWEAMEDARACKIIAEVPTAPGWQSDWSGDDGGFVDLVETMIRFEKALAPEISVLSMAPD